MSSEMKPRVGIDVSKAALDVAILPQGGSFRVSNDETGIDELATRIEGLDPALVVLEATGGFERAAATALAVRGLPIAVVNPRQARDFARATGRLAKSDAIDAAVLARFAEAVRPAPKALPDQEAREFSAILSRRRQIIGMLTAEKNRLSASASEAV